MCTTLYCTLFTNKSLEETVKEVRCKPAINYLEGIAGNEVLVLCSFEGQQVARIFYCRAHNSVYAGCTGFRWLLSSYTSLPPLSHV